MTRPIPRILLLGDSIRMSYQPRVAQLLEGRAEVLGPADNCGCTVRTLAFLDQWVAELGPPDLIHWNNGLHDAAYIPERAPHPPQLPIDEYRANLVSILERLRKFTSRVIWATTTPVHPNYPFKTDSWSCRNEDVDRYNPVATEIMRKQGVPINDLNQRVRAHLDEYLGEDHIHLSQAGVEACAQAVAHSIMNSQTIN